MSTKPSNETRHRWTRQERDRLIAESEGYETVSEAADALYVKIGMPRRAVYAQLYDLFLKGRVPHLQLSKEEQGRENFTPALARALRELVRVMRHERISDVLVSVHEASTSIQVSRASKSYDIDL